MSLLQPDNSDGTPNGSAMFAYCLCIDGLYHRELTPAEQYAALAGAEIIGKRIDPDTYEPDYVILGDGTTAVVCLAGTTNDPQWIGHAGSAFIPVPDYKLINGGTVASFEYGTRIREPEIFAFLAPYFDKEIVFVGHSYGGAAANILAAHLAVKIVKGTQKVLTFGEPKSYTRSTTVPTPAYKARIVNAITPGTVHGLAQDLRDPITLMPPGQIEFIGFGYYGLLVKLIGGLGFVHSGDEWFMTPTKVTGPFSYPLAFNVPFYELAQLIELLNKVTFLHFMDTAYLGNALRAWQRSGTNPELQALLPTASRYLDQPALLPSITGPTIPAAAINESAGLPSGTITEANRTTIATVVVSASVEITPTFSGESSMGFKITLLLAQDNEGTTQSFYTVGPNSPNGQPWNYQSAFQAGVNMIPLRTALSQCPDQPKCVNPLTIPYIRVDNQAIARGTEVFNVINPSYSSFIAANPPWTPDLSFWGNSTFNNDAANSCWKGTMNDGAGHEANFYFHGVPLYSEGGTGLAGGIQLPNIGGRTTTPYARWLTNLYSFCNGLRTNMLGFRGVSNIWTPNGANPAGLTPPPLNGTPLPGGIFYNLPGTPLNTYSFIVAQLPPTNLSNSRGTWPFILRSFKNLRVVNGRWPANCFTITAANIPSGASQPSVGDYCVNVLTPFTNYLPWDGRGYLCPATYGVYQPAPCPPLIPGTGPTGISDIILTAKKTGRPPELQRGRSRNRAR